jgi:haloalkane dehalogenase
MPTTGVLDSTIHHEESGGGTPVVFLHGNPSSSRLCGTCCPPWTCRRGCSRRT